MGAKKSIFEVKKGKKKRSKTIKMLKSSQLETLEYT